MNPLGIVKQIIEEAGMGISYVYEDLVFVEHNSYLLQFTDNKQEMLVHRNDEADEGAVSEDIGRLDALGQRYRMRFLKGRIYTLIQDDDEHIRLEFTEAA